MTYVISCTLMTWQAGTPAGMEDSAALGLFDIDTLKKQTDGTFLDNTDMEFDFLEVKETDS